MKNRRSKYDGVLSILKYNVRSYAAGCCVMLGIGMLLWFRLLPPAADAVLIAAAALTGFWTLSSLAASYYVYDYAGVTRWRWIPRILMFSPQNWLNIHAGLDQSTATLRELFPNTGYTVVDIYDAREMPEPSIARARRLQSSAQLAGVAQTASVGTLDALPLCDNDSDTLFLLFAAHEIRRPARRLAFFREASRVLANSGQLLLVEHMRDWKNFVAFGPGFLHFYSRNEWLRVAQGAGLTVEQEDHVTPLVRYFLMRKAGP
jgi:SAM-dependent methyltransferase